MAATLDGDPIGRRQLLRTLGLTAGVTAVGGACSLDFGDPERPNSLWIRQAARAPGPAHDRTYRQVGWIVDDRRVKERGMFPGAAAPFAYSHLELTTPDVARAREFYQNTLATHLAYDDPGDSATGVGPQSYLRFGENPSCSDRASSTVGRPTRIGSASRSTISIVNQWPPGCVTGGGWTRSRSRSSGGRSPILMVLRVDIAGGWSAGASRARMRGRSGAVPRGAGGVACGSVSA